MKKLLTLLTAAAMAGAAACAQARGKAGAATASTRGSQVAPATMSDALRLTNGWPEASQLAARAMLDRYGEPDLVSDVLLVWTDRPPFTRIMVQRDGLRHRFPAEHQDVLTQEIRLGVPLDKLAELARFDGSILVDRTKGTVASRADTEASNILALNLADEIISGKRDYISARQVFTTTLAKQASGKSSPYTERLRFSVSGDTSFTDDLSGGGVPDGPNTMAPSSGASDRVGGSDTGLGSGTGPGSETTTPLSAPSNSSVRPGPTQGQGGH